MGFVLLTGSGHPTLAGELASALGTSLGAVVCERFPDGELAIEVNCDVRAQSVYVVQPLNAPVGERLLELALLADACRRSGAARVTAVIPYLGYARQDRRELGREPLGARVMAELLAAGRVDRLVCLDLHSRAIEGCFPQPVEHCSALPALAQRLLATVKRPAVVISPDLGAVKRAQAFAKALSLPVAIVHKHRSSGSQVEATGVVGEVKGLTPVVVDDIISTGGTMVAAIRAVLDAGAVGPVTVAASHGLFVGPAYERLRGLPIERVVVSNSVPVPTGAPFQVDVVSTAEALAEAVRRLER